MLNARPVMPPLPNSPASRETIRSAWGRFRGLAVVLFASLCLSGCVRYDMGVSFDSQTHGQIVQQIRLSERLTSFSQATVQEWLQSIEKRARSLHGRTKRISDRELTVKIPFNNGAELVEKFNQFFDPTASQPDELEPTATPDLPQVSAHLSLLQNNALLALRNRLSVDLDLRGLGSIADNDRVSLATDSLFEINFALNTPWGAHTIGNTEKTAQPQAAAQQVVWKLTPGQINHFEAVFWVPSPIGIGAIAIIFLAVSGHLLKHRFLPAMGWDRQPRQRKQLVENR